MTRMTARSLIFLPSILLPALAFAQQTPQSPTEAELTSLLAIYKDIHAHPELSMHEERSASIVAKELKTAGCEVTERVGKYERPGATCFGVVGVMKNGAGPTVLVRTDLDALPVHEETGLPYASTVTTKNDEGKEVPVMHACGHDIHMSTRIGTARALAKLKDQWHGTIIFIGQPAEEAIGGARAMLKDGLYTRWPKPDYALALHDDAEIATGKIGLTEGYAFANVDSVDVIVHGVGGHGAYPHKTKDPIVLSAEITNAWQTIVSREKNPIDPLVITVGSIHGGTKHNIIPDEVKMQLTVRTYKREVREKALGNDNVVTKDPSMGAEDFSEYSLPDHSIAALMFTVGAVDPAKVAESKKTGVSLPSLHSSKFAPVPEPTIRTGIVG